VRNKERLILSNNHHFPMAEAAIWLTFLDAPDAARALRDYVDMILAQDPERLLPIASNAFKVEPHLQSPK
jgi:hypothetical protein